MERFEVCDIVEVVGKSSDDVQCLHPYPFIKEMHKYIGEKARITSRISSMYYEVKFLNAGVQQIHKAELKDTGIRQTSWRFHYSTLKKVML